MSETCPYGCGSAVSCRTKYSVSYRCGSLGECEESSNITQSAACKEIVRIRAALAAAEKRVAFLEDCAARDIIAARGLHPTANSVGGMATVVGARLRALESDRARLERQVSIWLNAYEGTKQQIEGCGAVIENLQQRLSAAEKRAEETEQAFERLAKFTRNTCQATVDLMTEEGVVDGRIMPACELAIEHCRKPAEDPRAAQPLNPL